MANQDNKFVYYYKKSEINPYVLNAIVQNLEKLKHGLGIEFYFVDLETNQVALENFLKNRDGALENVIEDQMNKNIFMLANKFGDVWFWEINLIQYLQGEVLEQIFNYYQGVRTLHNEDEFLITLSDNDVHFITFVPQTMEFNDANKAFKNFRRFNTKNTDHFLNIKYWHLQDHELAQSLGIDINGPIGDVYMVKKCTQANELDQTHVIGRTPI